MSSPKKPLRPRRAVSAAAIGRNGERKTIFFGPVECYRGEWKNDKRHGRGHHTYPDKRIYDGEWENDKRHGQGALFAPDGSLIYDGGWREGRPHGLGVLERRDGSVYVGQWVDGEREGYGVYRAPPPERASVTEFASADAEGRLIGRWFRGRWSHGLAHGDGSLVEPDGTTFRGQFVHGKRTGVGVVAFVSAGRQIIGCWEDDKLVAGVCTPILQADYDRVVSIWTGQPGYEWPGAQAALGPLDPAHAIDTPTSAELEEEQNALRNGCAAAATAAANGAYYPEVGQFEAAFRALSSPRNPATEWGPPERSPQTPPLLGIIPRGLPMDEVGTQLVLLPRPPVAELPALTSTYPDDLVEFVSERFGKDQAELIASLLAKNSLGRGRGQKDEAARQQPPRERTRFKGPRIVRKKFAV